MDDDEVAAVTQQSSRREQDERPERAQKGWELTPSACGAAEGQLMLLTPLPFHNMGAQWRLRVRNTNTKGAERRQEGCSLQSSGTSG